MSTELDPATGISTLPLADVVFDHAAVAAHRIRDLLPIYRNLLGGQFHLGGDNVRVGYRGLQLRYGDGSKIELLEPLEGSTFLDSFFRRNPLGGLHHLTFKIVSMTDALAALAGLGYIVHGQSDADPNWNEVFVHPREALGTLLQLAQAGPNYGVPPEYGLADVLAGRGNHGNGVPSR